MERYLVAGGTVDEAEDEFDCWSREYIGLEFARKAMEASVPVRDASRAISPGYFVRVDQWDDELGGWQPCERGRTWTVVGFDGIRPDKGLSDGFEVAGHGPDRALCPDFGLLAEASALVQPYERKSDVPRGFSAWREGGGWIGVRPLWGEGPHARSSNSLPRHGKLHGAVESPWVLSREAMRVADGARELADLGLFVGNIHQALMMSEKRVSGLAKLGRGLYCYMP